MSSIHVSKMNKLFDPLCYHIANHVACHVGLPLQHMVDKRKYIVFPNGRIDKNGKLVDSASAERKSSPDGTKANLW